MLAAVTLLGVIAGVLIPRLSGNSTTVKKNSCYAFKGFIEVQAQLWFRNKGVWPATNLADIAADKSYFPEGLLVCPVDGSAYTLDSTTHKVSGHSH